MNYVQELSVTNLWGYKSYSLTFHDDVNVIIGPNASGKTALINILHDTFNGNLMRLFQTEFSEVTIQLKAFDGNSEHKLRVSKPNKTMRIEIDDKKVSFPLSRFFRYRDDFDDSVTRSIPSSVFLRQHPRAQEVRHQLRQLVPAVWLPVSRRLPIAREEELEERRLHRKPLESVDESLEELLERLQKYRLNLNTVLSDLRRDFQQKALKNILYDRDRDKPSSRPGTINLPSEDDKQALRTAFADVGLNDENIAKKITEHFKVASNAVSDLHKEKSSKKGFSTSTLFIIPLINRTQAIVSFAQELEQERKSLFATLHNFESILNSFFNDKRIEVLDTGILRILPQHNMTQEITWRQLSSGEKQMLILLTQALLSEKDPTVYIADEPELSLHVDWQEKLLHTLTGLTGRCQFIVATHSPDITSGFGEKVIDLGDLG